MNDAFDKLPKLIAAISFAAMLVFVSREWSYFQVIGPGFLLLFTTYDFVSSAIIWIIPAAVGGAMGFWLSSMSPDYNTIPRDPSKGFLRNLIATEKRLIIVFSIFAFMALIASYLSAWTVLSPLAIIVAIISTFAIAVVYDKYGLRKTMGLSPLRMVATMIALVILAAGTGYDRAYSDLRHTRNVYKVTLADRQSVSKKTVLRIIEKGIIAVDRKTNQIAFVPMKRISELAKEIPDPYPKRPLCSWINVGCK